ncbi:MAG: peptide deformylase [Clostridia bacterium]|nr:peptide deformylase [Clostridia bacterium]
MAIRHIVTEGDEILRKKCREVTEVTDRIKMTLEDMLETMHSEFGVGIAAPQVGVMRRMFIAEPEEGRIYYMINPEILETERSQMSCEGCLSVPGLVGDVERPERIKIKAMDLDGNEQVYEFEGFDATVMCHENDHLDGILYIDKAENIRKPEAPEEGDEE